MNKPIIDINKLACTTMIVGKNATSDGSVIVSHSDDDVSDTRVVLVPRQKGGKDIIRPIYYDNCSIGSNQKYNSTDIRRYIGKSRGPVYDTGDYKNSIPLGEIPQPKETYAYYDACYGIMNEHNLMIGECTCGSKVTTSPEVNKRIFYTAELSRVALERCKTAKEAIELIGELMYTYGYYGTGETLLLGDSNEAWVMEICSYSKTSVDPIWVARKVDDNHFFVAANEFRIRDIHHNPNDHKKITNKPLYFYSDKDNKEIIYSANLFKACEMNGWIKSDAEHLDWLPTVSYGEYNHPYYSLRRVWRALSIVNPNLHLPQNISNGYTRAYPFSVKPYKKLSVLDIASIYRDHYENTDFDQTKGRAAGPFGCPVRYELNQDSNNDVFNLNKYLPKGAWERTLSIYRCGMLWINQAKNINNKTLGISWNGLDRPASNCLMPLITTMTKLPKGLETMNLLKFKFQGESAWWAFNFVGNYINLNYSYMIEDVKKLQSILESKAYDFVSEYFTKETIGDSDEKLLRNFCYKHVGVTTNEWWLLAVKLIVKYNNGCLTTEANSIMNPINYPEEWLKDVDYYKGPTKY